MEQPALSTMWMRNRHQSLGEFFDEAQGLGFDTFELNHFVTRDLVEGASLSGHAIPAVHAPCPVQPGKGRAQMSSLDKEERTEAVQDVQASIDLAQQIGARAVIVHPGLVPANPEWERQLRALYNRGQKESSEYQDIKAELVETRARYAQVHLDAVRWSLERLANAADSAGVKIALENRFHYNEIPNPDELDLLMRDFSGPVGFWLDSGHAYIQEELGFVGHIEWQNGFSQDLVGIHLHDVRTVPQLTDPGPVPEENGEGLKDHLVPIDGVVNFAELKDLATDSVLLTCEFDWYHSPEAVQQGLDDLRNMGFS